MKDNEMEILFKSLSKILSNQDEIIKHFGLNRYSYEWGWDDNVTEKLSDKCSEVASRYEMMCEYY